MKITAEDLHELGVIDTIIPEPMGGAHRDRNAATKAAKEAIETALAEFEGKNPDEIRQQRHDKFLAIGRTL